MRFTFFLVICLSLSISSGAQELNQIQQESIHELLSPYLRMDRPGFAILVSRGDQILFRKGYGMADLEHGVPVNPKTVFYAGSVSKQFVASCVLFLAEEGKIDLDESIRTYFPDFPEAKEIGQTEEHCVIESSQSDQLAIGDPIIAIPKHACPTSAVHQSATIISDGKVTDTWEIAARDRFLTI